MVGVEMLVVIVVVMFGVVLAFVICVIIDVDMVAVVIVIVEGDEMVIVVEVVVGVVFGMHFLFFSSHIQQACHHGYSFFLKSRFHINASTIISI